MAEGFCHKVAHYEVIERPLKLYCDNKSVVLYSNNNKVQSGQFSIEH